MLREETARRGILLIDDEVMSFRISYRGALAEYGIPPDLVCLAKIIGGGVPVGAVARPNEVMSVFDHTRSPQVHHSGTFNANPVTMTAGLETMKQMTEEAFGRLDRMGEYLREQLARRLLDRGIAIRITGKGSLFAGHLMREAPRDFRSIAGGSRPQAFYTELCHRMLACGIVSSARGIFGCLSTPMTDAELDAYVDAVERSLVALDYKG